MIILVSADLVEQMVNFSFFFNLIPFPLAFLLTKMTKKSEFHILWLHTLLSIFADV